MQTYREELDVALKQISFGNDATYEQNMAALTELFLNVRRKNGSVYFIGNGGSAGIATHMTADFLKNGKMRAISLYDVPTITCLANDFGYAEVFCRQLDWLARPGDLLVAISSSGESKNIINAVQTAKEKKCHVVTITGFRAGNTLRTLGEINIHVPSSEYGIVESIHNMILQQTVDEILRRDKILAQDGKAGAL